MASLNKVFLLGNLTRDPDFRNTSSGSAVCDFGLATTRRFMANGQQQEETCFVDITVWGKPAENCNKYLSKGSQVMIEGRLKFDQWEDRNGGGKRSKLIVIAEVVQFIGGKREGGNQAQPEQPPRRGVDSDYAPPPPMPEDQGDYCAENDIPF